MYMYIHHRSLHMLTSIVNDKEILYILSTEGNKNYFQNNNFLNYCFLQQKKID